MKYILTMYIDLYNKTTYVFVRYGPRSTAGMLFVYIALTTMLLANNKWYNQQIRLLYEKQHQVNLVSISTQQYFLTEKSPSKTSFCNFQQNVPSHMRLTARGHFFCSSINGRTIMTSRYVQINLFHLIVIWGTINNYSNYTMALF